MPVGGPSVWIAALIGALVAGLSRIVAAIPAFLGAIIILLIGWGVGKLVQAVVIRVLHALHFETLTEHAGINGALRRAEIKADASTILGVIAYWFIFLIAINAAVSVLGIPVLTAMMAAIVLYLPRIFAALIVVIIGAWVASLLGRLTNATAAGAGIAYSDILGSVVQGAVIFFTFAMALDMIGLSFPFLTTAFAIIVGAIGLAAAIAFGLGGREYATDMLAGRELRALYRAGDRVTTDDFDGTVQQINPTFTLVRTSSGDLAVQNSELMHKHVTRPSGSPPPPASEGGGSMPKAA